MNITLSTPSLSDLLNQMENGIARVTDYNHANPASEVRMSVTEADLRTLIGLTREALMLRGAVIAWHVADKTLIDELCHSDDPGGPSGPTVNAQMVAEDALHGIAKALIEAHI